MAKSEDLTKQEFKAEVMAYFKHNAEVNKTRKVERGVAVPITLPALAEHLGWPTTRLINYPEDGKYFEIIEFAKVKCENFLLDSIYAKTVNLAIAKMLLETYHGYGTSKQKEKENKKRLRSISTILNEIEANG